MSSNSIDLLNADFNYFQYIVAENLNGAAPSPAELGLMTAITPILRQAKQQSRYESSTGFWHIVDSEGESLKRARSILIDNPELPEQEADIFSTFKTLNLPQNSDDLAIASSFTRLLGRIYTETFNCFDIAWLGAAAVKRENPNYNVHIEQSLDHAWSVVRTDKSEVKIDLWRGDKKHLPCFPVLTKSFNHEPPANPEQKVFVSEKDVMIMKRALRYLHKATTFTSIRTHIDKMMSNLTSSFEFDRATINPTPPEEARMLRSDFIESAREKAKNPEALDAAIEQTIEQFNNSEANLTPEIQKQLHDKTVKTVEDGTFMTLHECPNPAEPVIERGFFFDDIYPKYKKGEVYISGNPEILFKTRCPRQNFKWHAAKISKEQQQAASASTSR